MLVMREEELLVVVFPFHTLQMLFNVTVADEADEVQVVQIALFRTALDPVASAVALV